MRKSFLAIILFVVSLVPSIHAFGQGRTGSIQIEYHRGAGSDTEILLAGVEFVLYRVGSMQNGVWTLSGKFEEAGISLEGENSSERAQQAEALYAFALDQRLEGQAQMTNSEGITKFDKLPEGLYLVAQTEKLELGSQGTFTSAPFLLSIPEEVNGNVLYDIVAKPKAGKEEIPQPEQDSDPEDQEASKIATVKAGDSMAVEPAAMAAVLSMAAIIALRYYKKKYETENKVQ